MHIEIMKNDASAIDKTVQSVVELAYSPADTRAVRSHALLLTMGTKSKDQAAKRLFDPLRRHIKYQFDPRNREFVQRPAWLLQHGRRGTHLAAGDCDDHSAVQLALCSALGLRCRIVLTENPDNMGPLDDPWFEHIHIEVEIEPERWRPIDSSLEWLDFGERATGSRRKYIDPEALGERVLNGRPSLGFADLVAKGAGMATDIAVSVIGGEAQKKAAKYAAHAKEVAAQAELRLLEEQARLDFEAAQLSMERIDAANRELLVFQELEKQARRGAMMPLYIVGAGAVALLAYSYWRKS